MLNIDGYKYISDNWYNIKDTDSTESTRMKNMNSLECSDGKYGVDLSRNFGYQWGYDDTGSSPDPCHSNYRGSSAFSEPETRGLRNLAFSLDVVLYMSYETGVKRYINPYSYKSGVDYSGRRGWFYFNITNSLDWGYEMGTVHELYGTFENGVDIDFFDNTVGSAAINARLKEVNLFEEDLEYGSPITLVENYDMFKRMVIQSSNTFATNTIDTVSECLENC